MNILLIGSGKMGNIVEQLAIEKGHTIVAKYHTLNPFNAKTFLVGDVAIDFSNPSLVKGHTQLCFEKNIPLVEGTTGWNEQFESVSAECLKMGGTLLTSSNFSLGVNLFFEMTKKLSVLIDAYDYNCSISEIHHTEKIDKPSGTAITLAESVISHSNRYANWALYPIDSSPEICQVNVDNTLLIHTERLHGVFGKHSLSYENSIDIIRFEHEAKSRIGFAKGAIMAAEWLIGKRGVFDMSDFLNFAPR
ncbi:MAG: 4-hydroxy-tetrahydrodipicolinate reductase [Flavobacteriales bacterium]|nr:MAG: 4-hydroxy-tetrahydrodipicolinate reductase [Flavobacteriales bacterium]